MLNTLHITNFINERLQILQQHGISININQNIEEIYQITQDIPEKSVSPLFTNQFFDLNETNSLFIIGKDIEEKVVHIQAAKLDDIKHLTLDQLIEKQLKRAFQSNFSDPVHLCPAFKKISGKVAYHGEMWLHNSKRGHGLGDILGQLGQAIIYNTFQPDYIYAFIEAPVSQTGFIFRQGYWNFHPLNQEWLLSYPWLFLEDWMAWMSRENMEYLFNIAHEKKSTPHQRP